MTECFFTIVDYLFGEQPVEQQEFPWERREKFQADWMPEAMPDLEDMVTDKEILQLMEGTEDLPAIWVISDGLQPSATSSIQIDVSDS